MTEAEAKAAVEAEAAKKAEAEAKAAAKAAALEEEAKADPRPDDLLEVRITGPCTLGPGGQERIGSIHTLPRSRVPKFASQHIRVVKRGKKPD